MFQQAVSEDILYVTPRGLRVKKAKKSPDFDLLLTCGWKSVQICSDGSVVFHARRTPDVKPWFEKALGDSWGYERSMVFVEVNDILIQLNDKINAESMLAWYNRRVGLA